MSNGLCGVFQIFWVNSSNLQRICLVRMSIAKVVRSPFQVAIYYADARLWSSLFFMVCWTALDLDRIYNINMRKCERLALIFVCLYMAKKKDSITLCGVLFVVSSDVFETTVCPVAHDKQILVRARNYFLQCTVILHCILCQNVIRIASCFRQISDSDVGHCGYGMMPWSSDGTVTGINWWQALIVAVKNTHRWHLW